MQGFFDVITFGSALVDIFVDTALAEKGKFMCYATGTKIKVNHLRFDVGGGGTNTSVAFSRFGFKTGYIGKLGKDNDGKLVLQVLNKDKIKFLGKIDSKRPTGHSIVLDSKERNRTILTYKGASDDISLKDIKNYSKLKTQWLYFSSLLGKSFDTQIKLARIMKKKGTKIAFNPSAYLIREKNLKPLIRLVDVLILNKEEAQLLTGRKTKLLGGLLELGAKIAVITDQENPILCSNGIKTYSLMPHKIKVVERTGAGDAFASGFVAGLIAGKDIQSSLKLGLKESESVIRHFGAKNKLLKMHLRCLK